MGSPCFVLCYSLSSTLTLSCTPFPFKINCTLPYWCPVFHREALVGDVNCVLCSLLHTCTHTQIIIKYLFFKLSCRLPNIDLLEGGCSTAKQTWKKKNLVTLNYLRINLGKKDRVPAMIVTLGVFLWYSRLRIQHCYCRGLSCSCEVNSIPALELLHATMSTAKKKKKKN